MARTTTARASVRSLPRARRRAAGKGTVEEIAGRLVHTIFIEQLQRWDFIHAVIEDLARLPGGEPGTADYSALLDLTGHCPPDDLEKGFIHELSAAGRQKFEDFTQARVDDLWGAQRAAYALGVAAGRFLERRGGREL